MNSEFYLFAIWAASFVFQAQGFIVAFLGRRKDTFLQRASVLVAVAGAGVTLVSAPVLLNVLSDSYDKTHVAVNGDLVAVLIGSMLASIITIGAFINTFKYIW